MKKLFKKYSPPSLYNCVKSIYYFCNAFWLRLVGRKPILAESSKCYQRRLREDFFHKYCNGRGLDIGYGGDLVFHTAQGWDFENGDAQYLKSLPDYGYDYVYSSHTLEHMINPSIALSNWWRVLKKGGYLIIYIPDRDLYEKKKTLPSNWNLDHKFFFTLEKNEPPCTIGINQLISEVLSDYVIIYSKVCSEGYISNGQSSHSSGEYSIEVVLEKI